MQQNTVQVDWLYVGRLMCSPENHLLNLTKLMIPSIHNSGKELLQICSISPKFSIELLDYEGPIQIPVPHK